VYRSQIGRTITEADNVWFTALTMNSNQVHFNAEFAKSTRFSQPLVNSCLTVALVTGLSVPDTSANGVANLSWTDVELPQPVFVGDTLWAESEILYLRESRSKPDVGVVSMRTRGINQRGEVVIRFKRSFLCYRRGAPQAAHHFPEPNEDWS
jgi:itaconyl-CoA hydratase